MELKASKLLDIRFSEVDSMNVVWHGSYPLYFEDARELFGQKYDLTYMGFFDHGYFAPLVELTFQYKKPIRYGMRPRIDIVYRSTPAAKIVFDYEIHDPEDETTTKFTIQKTKQCWLQDIVFKFSWTPTINWCFTAQNFTTSGESDGECSKESSNKDILVMVYRIADNIVSPLGMTTAENYRALKAGHTALRHYSHQWGLPEPFTAALFSQEQTEAMCHFHP